MKIKKMMDDKMNEEKEKIRMEAVKEMEMQLHEQFSVNYNSTYSTTIALFCSLLAVLYGYGHIYLNSNIEFAANPGEVYCDCTKLYTLDALVYATIAANVVLAIMKYICLRQGVNQRLEQFLVHAIRTKYYNQDPTEMVNPKIYPFGYTPFWKKGEKIVVGIYGELITIICALQILVMVGLLYKLIWNIWLYSELGFVANAFWEIFFLVVISIICYGQYHYVKKENLYEKYKKRNLEYWCNKHL